MPALRRTDWLLIAALVALALNLRPALAAIGPLLGLMDASLGMSSAQAGLLTTLPVFVMGLGALWGRQLHAAVRAPAGMALGMVLIAAACAARFWTGQTGSLLWTAAVAGVGIALVQTLAPGFIKHHFKDEAGRVFGLYVTGIMGGAAAAAAGAPEVARHTGWPLALALWAVPAVLALLLWCWMARSPRQVRLAPEPTATPLGRVFWRNRRAWALLVFFGIGTGAYTLVLAWLAPFYTGLGWSPSQAGLLLGNLTVAEVVAGLAVSAWIGRFPDRRQPLLFALLALVAGLLCLLLAPLPLAWPASVLLGLGIGALFPLSLIVTLDHVPEPVEAGLLVAFVQGGGYILASAMPLLAGVLRDRFADLSQAWALMLVGALALVALSRCFSPASYSRIDV